MHLGWEAGGYFDFPAGDIHVARFIFATLVSALV